MLKFFNNGAPQITMERLIQPRAPQITMGRLIQPRIPQITMGHSTEHSNQQVVCMQEVAYA